MGVRSSGVQRPRLPCATAGEAPGVPAGPIEGATDQEAHEAAVAAVQSVLPLPWKEASAEAVDWVAAGRPFSSSVGAERRRHGS